MFSNMHMLFVIFFVSYFDHQNLLCYATKFKDNLGIFLIFSYKVSHILSLESTLITCCCHPGSQILIVQFGNLLFCMLNFTCLKNHLKTGLCWSVKIDVSEIAIKLNLLIYDCLCALLSRWKYMWISIEFCQVVPGHL